MKKREIEQRLAEEVKAATPDVLENVLAGAKGPKAEKDGNIAEITALPKRPRSPWKALVAAAAAVAVVAGGTLFAYNRISNGVDSIVQLDVNPSVEMKVNSAEKVLSAQALNEDAQKILGDMDLKGASLDVALNALIGSMLRNGYIDDLANSILITVENKDSAKGAQLQEKLSSEVERLLQDSQVNGAVLSQTTAADDELTRLAQEYNISVGKAALVRQLVAADSMLDFASLAKLPINDLNLLATSRQIALDGVSSSGQASSGAYIGEDKAKEIAFGEAGATDATATRVEISLDCDDGRMLYEVDFWLNGSEYEYEIDASTGEVWKWERDDKTPPASTGSTTSPSSGAGSTTSGTTGSQPGNSTDFLSPEEALNAALSHAGVSSQTAYDKNVDFDYDDGVPEYEVEFRNDGVEYEYKIHAETGAVLHWKSEDHSRPAGTTADSQEIGVDKAKELALARAGLTGDVPFQKIEREYDDGRLVYQLEFWANGVEYECEIDAMSGAFLDWESERDD